MWGEGNAVFYMCDYGDERLTCMYRNVDDCMGAKSPPWVEGPTRGDADPLFVEPRPKWYNCSQT